MKTLESKTPPFAARSPSVNGCRVRSGNAPQNLAALRNAVINLLCLSNTPNIAATLRKNAYRIDQLFPKLDIMKN